MKAKQLFETYQAWSDEAGASNWTNTGFNAAMMDKGFEQKTSNGVWWIGVKLREGITSQAIRDGEWDGPVVAKAGDLGEAESSGAGSGDRGADWATGDSDDWVPGD